MKLLLKTMLLGMACSGISSCCDCELASDEELRRDIVGKWERVVCEYPITDDGNLPESPLRNTMTFYADGRVSEDGYYSYCCIDSCNGLVRDCGWVIDNGNLIIVPEPSYSLLWLNQPFPIYCISDNELVINNVEINGNRYKKACYQKM